MFLLQFVGPEKSYRMLLPKQNIQLQSQSLWKKLPYLWLRKTAGALSEHSVVDKK